MFIVNFIKGLFNLIANIIAWIIRIAIFAVRLAWYSLKYFVITVFLIMVACLILGLVGLLNDVTAALIGIVAILMFVCGILGEFLGWNDEDGGSPWSSSSDSEPEHYSPPSYTVTAKSPQEICREERKAKERKVVSVVDEGNGKVRLIFDDGNFYQRSLYPSGDRYVESISGVSNDTCTIVYKQKRGKARWVVTYKLPGLTTISSTGY